MLGNRYHRTRLLRRHHQVRRRSARTTTSTLTTIFTPFRNAGIISFIQHEWIRLDFPSILRYFFIVRMMEQYLKLSMDPTTEPTMYEIVKYLMMNGCDSFLSLLAMISTITYLCCCLDKLFHRVSKDTQNILRSCIVIVVVVN